MKTSARSPLLAKSQVATGEAPEAPSDEDLHREGIKSEMRMATRDYVAGRISTKKHNQIHARGKKCLREMSR